MKKVICCGTLVLLLSACANNGIEDTAGRAIEPSDTSTSRISLPSPIPTGLKGTQTAIGNPLVFDIQSSLTELGYAAGSIDGHYGLKIQAAIVRYQIDQGLPADGYATPELAGHIRGRISG